MSPLTLLVLLIATALIHDFVNGIHDGANDAQKTVGVIARAWLFTVPASALLAMPLRRMVALVQEQAQDLRLAIQQLQKCPRVASDHVNRVLEKKREFERVYRHISNMADRAVSAANVLGMVVVKIA
jgi:hypothetical protein